MWPQQVLLTSGLRHCWQMMLLATGLITRSMPAARDRHIWTFASNDGAMDIEINSLANDVTLDVTMIDVGRPIADNDVASSLVVSADGAADRNL